MSSVCVHSAVTLPSCSEVFALFPETLRLWSWLPDMSCPKVSMSVSLCLSVSMFTNAKYHGFTCTSKSGSRFPEALLTSSPPPHPLPSFQVWRKHTASFTFLQRSDKDTKHQLQTGDTGWCWDYDQRDSKCLIQKEQLPLSSGLCCQIFPFMKPEIPIVCMKSPDF